MDVARALYLDLTGNLSPRGALQGRKWIVEDLDLLSCYYYREGSLTARQWLKSLLGIREGAYLAADDLLPLVPLCVNRGWELLTGLSKTVVAPLHADLPAENHPRLTKCTQPRTR